MKTDKQKLEDLLIEFGVGFKSDVFSNVDRSYIKCKEGRDKVGGYVEFYTNFEFDLDGEFIELGAWE